MKLSNGRIEIGPELYRVLQRELDEINRKLAALKPNVEKDRAEMQKRHRTLWNY